MSTLTSSQLLSLSSQAVDLYTRTETTKYLALASCTLLVYDIISTLPSEVRYVWGSRWSFGRVVYHLNRLWAPAMLFSYVPSLFRYHQSNERCLSALLFYIYGTMAAMMIASSVMITRVWAIYEMKPTVIAALCIVGVVIVVPSVAIIQWQATQCHLAPNPAPDLVSGCRFNTTPLAILPYIAPFLFDTSLFVMTVYRIWKTSRTPLMTRLMNDGSQYYVIVMGTFLFVGLSALIPPISDEVNGSGLFIAVLSTMCARLIISTRSYYDAALFIGVSVEMDTVTEDSDVHRSMEWRVQQVSTDHQAGSGDHLT